MFFETRGGTLIPLLRIRHVSKARDRDREKVWTVELDDGVVEIGNTEYERIKTSGSSYFAAEPGTQLVDGSDAGAPFFEDVVAWRVETDGELTPLTCDGPWGGTVNAWAIKLPNGHVVRPLETTWDTLEQYLDHCRS